ncbi:MAG TPA: DUF4388 domain-containing protein, partial [bacterium]
LEEKSVEALVEDYGLQRKTGVLSLYDHNNRNGEIYFRDGAVVNARLGNFKAEKAVYQMLPWNRGHFVMDFKGINVEDEITVSNLGLLVQGVKQLQERANLLKQLPELETVLVRTSIFEQVLKQKTIAPDAHKFIALFDGHRSLNDVLAESTFDDIKTLEKTIKLYKQGFVKPMNGESDRQSHQDSNAAVPIPQVPDSKSKPSSLPQRQPNKKETTTIRVGEVQKFGANGPNVLKPPEEIDPFKGIKPPLPPTIASEKKESTKDIEVQPLPAINGGLKKETPPQKSPANNLGIIFDQLFNGRPDATGRLVVVSSDAVSRKNLIATLCENSFLSKKLHRDDELTFELAKIVTPNQRALEILGVSTERKFLQMIEQIAASLLAYVILIGDQNLSNLGYTGYLINSLKRQFSAIPHVIVFMQSKTKRSIPLDVVRYTLKLDEKEQLLESNPQDLESVKHLLLQLQSPTPVHENNGQQATNSAVAHPEGLTVNR